MSNEKENPMQMFSRLKELNKLIYVAEAEFEDEVLAYLVKKADFLDAKEFSKMEYLDIEASFIFDKILKVEDKLDEFKKEQEVLKEAFLNLKLDE